MRVYETLAAIYDRFNEESDPSAWTELILSLAEKHASAPIRSVVDAGCGTGSIAICMAKKGLSVTGLDLSPEMLAEAMQKARKAACRIPFVQMDMRRMAVHHPADLVLSACDGVNYLLSEADVRSFFRAARRALKPGGMLVFDVSTPYKLRSLLGNAFFGEERDEAAYLWQNSFDEAARRLKMDITFFIQTKDGLYRRENEVHIQRAHEAEELEAWLAQEGFTLTNTCAAPWDQAQQPLRLFFAARREN